MRSLLLLVGISFWHLARRKVEACGGRVTATTGTTDPAAPLR
jgi:hypothetical protein